MTETFTRETAWFQNSDRTLIGAVVFDRTDKDWAYVILGQEVGEELDGFRWIAGDTSLPAEDDAVTALVAAMYKLEEEDKGTEELYVPDKSIVTDKEQWLVFTDINEEVKAYLAKHPEKLFDLDARKFEELIASILKDFGCDVRLLQQTRDGGRDIIATLRTAVCKVLMFVECKRWAQRRKVGIEIVDRLAGVHHAFRPTKSLIVTTSSFTKAAREKRA